jgi:hypothetical protein
MKFLNLLPIKLELFLWKNDIQGGKLGLNYIKHQK